MALRATWMIPEGPCLQALAWSPLRSPLPCTLWCWGSGPECHTGRNVAGWPSTQGPSWKWRDDGGDPQSGQASSQQMTLLFFHSSRGHWSPLVWL